MSPRIRRSTLLGVALSAIPRFTQASSCGDAHTSAPDVAPSNARPGTHAGAIQEPDGFAVLKDDPNCTG